MERARPGQPDWDDSLAAHASCYFFATEYVRDKDILEAGSGSGYGARILKSVGARSVRSVDIDAESIRIANESYGEEGVEYVVDDCEKLDAATGPYETIVSFELIEHLEHPERFLDRVAELLTPNGVFLVSTPDRDARPPFVDGRPRNPHHKNEWRREEFTELLAGHFSEIDLRVQVQSVSMQTRLEAVEALRTGLLAANPLSVFFWRKWPFGKREERGWKKLKGLASPTPADYPIVPIPLAEVFGRPWRHVAICRNTVEEAPLQVEHAAEPITMPHSASRKSSSVR